MPPPNQNLAVATGICAYVISRRFDPAKVAALFDRQARGDPPQEGDPALYEAVSSATWEALRAYQIEEPGRHLLAMLGAAQEWNLATALHN